MLIDIGVTYKDMDTDEQYLYVIREEISFEFA